MASETSLPEKSSQLRPLKRYVTDHDASGKAIFSSEVPEEADFKRLPSHMEFFLGYLTQSFPVDMSENNDIATYKTFLDGEAPGLVNKGGSICRVVDFFPGSPSMMHRTRSLDYGVVLQGEMELLLDSGEVRNMGPGDIAVQRGTNHAWRNLSKDTWARMMFVLQEAVPLEINGEKLDEDHGKGLAGVKRSNT